MPFICPRCGYADSICWRTSRFVLYAVYCSLDELEGFEPTLAEKLRALRKGETLTDKGYTYWKRGSQPHIYRIRTDLKDFIRGDKVEKPKPPDLRQQRLTTAISTGTREPLRVMRDS